MKVRITFDVNMETRLAISDRFGQDKPASHGEVADTIFGIVTETLEDYVYDYNPDRDKVAEGRDND